jgi:hypothetical protein
MYVPSVFAVSPPRISKCGAPVRLVPGFRTSGSSRLPVRIACIQLRLKAVPNQPGHRTTLRLGFGAHPGGQFLRAREQYVRRGDSPITVSRHCWLPGILWFSYATSITKGESKAVIIEPLSPTRHAQFRHQRTERIASGQETAALAMGWVAKSIEISRRRKNLTFRHHHRGVFSRVGIKPAPLCPAGWPRSAPGRARPFRPSRTPA